MRFANSRNAALIVGCIAIGMGLAPRTSAQVASQCDQLQQLLDQYKRVHDACLAANANEKQVQESSEVCSHPSCQAYHSYVYGSAGQALTAKIAACLHAQQYAQAAADEQRRIDADQAAMYGNAAADANQLADQYNNQAAGVESYTMSSGVAQDIDGIYNTANSLSAQQSAYDSGPAANDTTVSANQYVPDPSDLSGFDKYAREAASQVLDQGIQNVVGKENYEYYTDAKNLTSGDTQKQLDGGFDLADKFNDKYNSGASKAVTHAMLPKLHNVYSNAFNLVDATRHALSCFNSTDPMCTDAGKQLEKQWNQLTGNPFGKPTNDWSELFGTGE